MKHKMWWFVYAIVIGFLAERGAIAKADESNEEHVEHAEHADDANAMDDIPDWYKDIPVAKVEPLKPIKLPYSFKEMKKKAKAYIKEQQKNNGYEGEEDYYQTAWLIHAYLEHHYSPKLPNGAVSSLVKDKDGISFDSYLDKKNSKDIYKPFKDLPVVDVDHPKELNLPFSWKEFGKYTKSVPKDERQWRRDEYLSRTYPMYYEWHNPLERIEDKDGKKADEFVTELYNRPNKKWMKQWAHYFNKIQAQAPAAEDHDDNDHAANDDHDDSDHADSDDHDNKDDVASDDHDDKDHAENKDHDDSEEKSDKSDD